jgi:hypothetical protein
VSLTLQRRLDGATASPLLSLDSSSGVVAFQNASGALIIYRGGTLGSSTGPESMRIDSSGNVGIGTSTPAGLLTVSGTIVTKYNTGLESYIAAGTYSAGTTGFYPVYSTTTVTGGTFGSNDTVVKYGAGGNNYVLLHGTTAVLSANASENVSIGTNSYTGRLFVSGSSTATTPTMVVREGVTSPLGGAAAFDVQKSSGTSIFFVSGSGRIGIGTTSPRDVLEVNGTIRINDGSVNALNYGTGASDSYLSYSIGTIYVGNTNTGFLFRTSGNSSAVSIDNSGNVGIATTNTNGNKLSIVGTTSITGSVLPGVTNTYDLGSTSYVWRNLYAANISGSLTGSNVSAGQVVVAGTGGVLSGSNNLFWSNSNGRLGIGSSSPGYELQIGNGSTVGTRTLAIIDSGYGVKLAGGNGNGILQSLGTTVPLEFQAGNGNNGNYIFSSTGNVGIGTATVTSKFHVYTTQSDATATPSVDINAAFIRLGDATTALTFNNGVGIKFHDAGRVHYSIGQLSGNFYMSQTSDNGNVLFSAARTDVIVFNSAGSVGVGTTSPQALLHVGAGNDVPTVSPTTAYVTALGTTNLAIRDSTNNVELLNYAFSGGGLIGTATSHSLGIRTANTTAMTIDTSQNVGIGTTLLDSKLVVNGTSVFSGSVNPDADNSRDLGSSTKRWRNLYSANISGSLTGSNVSAGQVVVAGTGGVLSGSNNFWWDNTNARVGIGTSSPAARLHVSDSQSSATVRINLSNTNANGGPLRIGYFPDSAGFHITSNGNPAHTNNPSTSITNDFSVRTSFEILNQNGTWNGSTGTQGWADFRFGTSGNGALVTTARFQTDGNVGIGSTTTISARLQVSGSSTASTPTMVVREGVSIPTAGAGVFDVQNSAGTSILFVSGSGAVGIGTTVSQLPTHKLHVSGKIGGGLYLDSSLEFLADGTTELKANSNLKLGYLLTTVINSSGNVGIGTGTPTARLNVLGSSTSANTPTAIIKEGVGSPTGGVGVFDVQNSAGTSILFVTGSGRVGINSTSPSNSLEVVGNVRISSTLTHLGLDAYFNQSATGNSYFYTPAFFAKQGGAGGGGSNYERLYVTYGAISNDAAGTGVYPNFQISNGGNVRFNIPSSLSNALGITGSLEPDADATRDLGSSTKRWRNLYVANVSGSLTGSNILAGQVVVAGTGGVLSGSNNFWWDNTNRYVGIGTSSPQDKLSVGVSSYTSNQDGAIRIQTTDSSIVGRIAIKTDASSVGRFSIDSPSADDGTYEETISMWAGNVGIGTVPTSSSDKLSVSGPMNVTGSIVPGTNLTYDLGSSTKKWRGIYASSGSITSLVTTAATTSGSYSKTFSAGESGKLTATVSPLSGENKGITFSASNGANLFDISFVSSESGFSLAKKYTVAVQYGASPVSFKTIDTGPYGSYDITVTFTKDSATVTRCTFSHNYVSSVNIAITIDVAANSANSGGTTVTIFP